MQRKGKTLGYFCYGRFTDMGTGGTSTDEIALNPAHFNNGTQDVMSTLVHEMVHLWQEHFGKPSRRGYHNKEWADKMESVGLIPSRTGAPGGSRTGQQCDHYVEAGGPFADACARLLSRHPAILYRDCLLAGFNPRAFESEDEWRVAASRKAASKTCYSCPGCGLNAWAKASAHLQCGVCRLSMAVRSGNDSSISTEWPFLYSDAEKQEWNLPSETEAEVELARLLSNQDRMGQQA